MNMTLIQAPSTRATGGHLPREICLFLAAAICLGWGDAFGTPSPGLDPGWAEALVQATDTGRIFGKDIVFTYGPFHQLATGQIGTHLSPQLIARWLAGLAFGSLMVIQARMSSFLWGVFLMLIVTLLAGQNYDVLMPLNASLVLIASCLLRFREPSDMALVLAAQSGLCIGMLTKLSYAAPALICFLICPIVFFFRAHQSHAQRFRMYALVEVVFPSALVPVLWLLSGQPLNALATFLTGPNVDIVKGYSSAMALSSPHLIWHLPLYWAGSLLVLLKFSELHRHRIQPPLHLERFVALLGLTLITWIVFKAGMVRHDGQHVTIAGFYLATMAAMVAAIAFGPGSTHSASARNRMAPLLLISFAAGLRISTTFSTPLTEKPLQQISSRPGNAALLLEASTNLGRREQFRAERRRHRADVRSRSERLPIPSDTTVDILPSDIQLVAAGGYRYRPRPIIQSYSAYSPRLQQLNRDFFRSPGAPEHVILSINPIGSRAPIDLDGPAILEIARSYAFLGLGSEGSLIYRRRPIVTLQQPRPLLSVQRQECRRFLPLGSDRLTCGWLPLPNAVPGSSLMIELKRNAGGHVQTLLFRPTEVEAVVKFSNGNERAYRLMDQASNLIPLIPFVEHTHDLKLFLEEVGGSGLASGRHVPRPVAMRINELTTFPLPTLFSARLSVLSPSRAAPQH